jgi:hypothetical protein
MNTPGRDFDSGVIPGLLGRFGESSYNSGSVNASNKPFLTLQTVRKEEDSDIGTQLGSC